MANAKTQMEKNGRRNPSRKYVMTHQQFGWWMEENGYLDRVAKWEMNEVRVIGNKAVHENFRSKEEAWTQFNYLEDILKTVAEKHAGHKRKHARNNELRPAKHMAAQKPRQNTKKTNTQSAKPQSGQTKKPPVKQQTVQTGKAARQSGQSRKQAVKQSQSEQTSVKQPRQSGQPRKQAVKQSQSEQSSVKQPRQSGQPRKQPVKQPQPSENKAAGAEKAARRRYYPRHRRTSGKGQPSNLAQ